MSQDLTFDKEKHEYRLKGNVLPSVTQVLRAAGLATDHSKTDPFYAERGTAVHEAIRLDLFGWLDDESLDEHVRPKVETFRQIKETLGLKPLLAEQVIHSPDYGYAGTIDLVAHSDALSKVVLLDWKTGAIEKWHELQLVAYWHALGENIAHFPEVGMEKYASIGLGVVSLANERIVMKWFNVLERRPAFDVFTAALRVCKAQKVYGGKE